MLDFCVLLLECLETLSFVPFSVNKIDVDANKNNTNWEILKHYGSSQQALIFQLQGPHTNTVTIKNLRKNLNDRQVKITRYAPVGSSHYGDCKECFVRYMISYIW